MHGLIFAELKKYVETRLSVEAWRSLLVAAGLPGKIYVMSSTYPDADVAAIVSAAAKTTGLPADAILEDFGEFIVPDLVVTYRPFIKPMWKTLDLIENTESTIHKAVRMRDPGAAPPELKCTRHSATLVEIVYNSPRKLCAVAKGIAKGVAKHYRENVTIEESTCMHRGQKQCTISVRLN